MLNVQKCDHHQGNLSCLAPACGYFLPRSVVYKYINSMYTYIQILQCIYLVIQ